MDETTIRIVVVIVSHDHPVIHLQDESSTHTTQGPHILFVFVVAEI